MRNRRIAGMSEPVEAMADKPYRKCHLNARRFYHPFPEIRDVERLLETPVASFRGRNNYRLQKIQEVRLEVAKPSTRLFKHLWRPRGEPVWPRAEPDGIIVLHFKSESFMSQ